MIGLIEAGLTTIPESLMKTSKANALAKRFGIPTRYLLLDVSLFYHEMKKMRISTRYGRPDIIHQFLLVSQYSPLNIKGELQVFIHTFNNDVIFVNPQTRIPKNYYQFVGLLQNLYMYGKVPPKGKWLLRLERNKNLKQVLNELGIERPILLHERGEKLVCDKAREFTYPPNAFLIGGFPKGDFNEDTIKLIGEKYSIKGGYPLEAWIVTDRLIVCLEKEVL